MSGPSHPSRESIEPPACGRRSTGGGIDLWHADLRHGGWPRLIGILSDQEHRRALAFTAEREARRYVVSHAVLRTLLGRATDTPAPEVRLRTGQGLKPVLESDHGKRVHFSLSRSGELVVIGLAPQPLGVDIERLTDTLDIEELANQVLTSCEQTAFQSLDPASRPTAFLQCWTRKEAYLKAIGIGLAVPPTTVEVCFKTERSAGAKPIPAAVDSATGWSIDAFAPAAAYLGAVAIFGRGWRVELNAFDTSSL